MTPVRALTTADTDIPVGPMPVAFDIAAVYRSHGASVARWAARLAGPALEAEDIVQEVFMIAQRKRASFRGDSSPARWLYRITERVVAHRRRRDRWRRWLSGAGDRAARDVPSLDPTPLDSVQRRQAAALFYQALEGMPQNHRSAFILFELEELSGAQIATLKGVNIATIWVWLHRARAHFLKRVPELEQGAGP